MPPRKRKREKSPKPVEEPKVPCPPRPFHSDGHQCTLCPKVVANGSRQSHACHVHGEFVLFECGYCWKQYRGNTINDVRDHILRMHEGLDPRNIIDYRGNLRKEIKELKEKCFPPVEKTVTRKVKKKKSDSAPGEGSQESNSKAGKKAQESKSKAENSLAKELRSILQAGSGSGNDLKCSLCSASMLYRKNAQRHAITHANLSIYECKYCDRKFSARRKKIIRTHIRYEHGEEINEDDFHDNSEKLKWEIQTWMQKCFPNL